MGWYFKFGLCLTIFALVVFGISTVIGKLYDAPKTMSFKVERDEYSINVDIVHNIFSRWDGELYLIEVSPSGNISSTFYDGEFESLSSAHSFAIGYSLDGSTIPYKYLLVCTSKEVQTEEELIALYNEGEGPNAVWLLDMDEKFSLTCE